MSQEYEGWQVPARPATIGLLAFVIGLVALVVATGTIYKHRYAPQTRPHPQRFHAPTLETIDTAPTDRKSIAPPAAPPGIADAMDATAAQGNALWAAR